MGIRMNDASYGASRISGLKKYILVLIGVWTGVVLLSLAWNVFLIQEETLEMARIQARIAFGKDIIYRRWNSMHGGVYAPVTEETPPNPYLAEIGLPERDIITPSGRRLTLINPAYMTRQAHELEKKESGIRGHLTSLKLVRKENAPDAWETKALQSFEVGKTEVSSVERMEDGKGYMRLMRPLLTEKSCLRCHARQGYRVGDIRGGISESIPMAPLWASSWEFIMNVAFGHLILWLISIGGIVLGARRLMQHEKERLQAESALKQRTFDLETTNKELEKFTYTISHDLRAPLRHIDGFAALLEKHSKNALDAQGMHYLEVIARSARTMGSLIDDLLIFSQMGRVEMKIRSVNLALLLQDILKDLQPETQGRTIEWKIAPLPEVQADSFMIRQALFNLISNAVKFTRPKGVAKIEIGFTQTQNETIIYVRDNGIGFDIKFKGKLFGVFQRLHGGEEFEGTGIGLANVKRIITRHNGRVWAESEMNQGAIFYFSLPKESGGRSQ